MDRIGPSELIVIAVLVLIVFGSRRLPDVARSLGRSARVFKSEVDEMKKESEAAKVHTASAPGVQIEQAMSVDATAPGTPSAPAVPATDGDALP